jgi:hypothetical protein
MIRTLKTLRHCLKATYLIWLRYSSRGGRSSDIIERRKKRRKKSSSIVSGKRLKTKLWEEETKIAQSVTISLVEGPYCWIVPICIINAVWSHSRSLILRSRYSVLCADTKTIRRYRLIFELSVTDLITN